MRGYPQFSFWISITFVKIYISCIIINRGKNTFELVGTVLNCTTCKSRTLILCWLRLPVRCSTSFGKRFAIWGIFFHRSSIDFYLKTASQNIWKETGIFEAENFGATFQQLFDFLSNVLQNLSNVLQIWSMLWKTLDWWFDNPPPQIALVLTL